MRGGKVPGAGVEEALGRGRELGVFDGGAVPTHVDGVHDGQSAAYAKDESEEDTDQRAGEEVHDDAMVCSVLPNGSLICASDARISGCR